MERVCERCASEDDDLVLVRAPAAGATPAATAGAEAGAGTELWCFECRSSADHATVDDG